MYEWDRIRRPVGQTFTFLVPLAWVASADPDTRTGDEIVARAYCPPETTPIFEKDLDGGVHVSALGIEISLGSDDLPEGVFPVEVWLEVAGESVLLARGEIDRYPARGAAS